MAKFSFTKYGDDEFVVRMDRDNAMRLLAMLGQSAMSCSLFVNDGAERPYDQLKEQLSQGQENFNPYEYRVTDSYDKVLGTYKITKT